MWSKLWRLFKVSCKDTIRYGWDILIVLLAAALIGPFITGDIIALHTAVGAWVLVVIFVILITMYMFSDDWVIENLEKKQE